ncbi:hypothetical protein AAF712_009247 [Marasmius tenuissimus]|uniref:Cyclin-domain-containing protein n=1 Tax=Marasmius tenuissimus TaxID=585030 RepID=A0ABR2ZRQ1_9AGAR
MPSHSHSSSTTTSLPPISYLDKHISNRNVAPLTPPDDVPPPHYSPSPNRLPPIISYPEDMVVDDVVPEVEEKSQLFFDAVVALDWLDFSRTRSAHDIAEKTCEIICYLWFSPAPATASPPSDSPSKTPSSTSYSPNHVFNQPSSASALQFSLNPAFVQFMQKLLETTQVSQSVIVLSLHYIYRLKERNRFTTAASGSEFRIAVAGLMMANKFLDDNTYTNKTWSEVSGIDLNEINRMEHEFLVGVDFNLYVDKATYGSWLNLLKGLVMAKERDGRNWRRSSHRGARTVRQPGGHITNTPHRYSTASSKYRSHHATHRARSTSPARDLPMPVAAPVPPRYTALPPPAPAVQQQPSPPIHAPVPRSGSKRTAEAAFSPTSASFSDIPTKRHPISLQIPETNVTVQPHSYSPLDVESFAEMSIDSPNAKRTVTTATHTPPRAVRGPETLATAYSLDERRRGAVPRNLYFYTLACSPMDPVEADRRKARLRYHQPPPPPPPPSHGHGGYGYPTPRSALPPVGVIHSASTSPDGMGYLPVPRPIPTHTQSHQYLQPQSQPPPPRYAHVQQLPPLNTHVSPSHTHTLTTRVSELPTPHEDHHRRPQQRPKRSPVQSAPFANAGPPGVMNVHDHSTAAYVYPTPRALYRRSAC